MAIRMRVYPAGMSAGMYGGMNGMGGAVSAQTYYNTKLSSQQQISNLQLQYERALWSQKLDTARLEERLKNPYAAYGGFGAGMGAYGGMPGLGGIPGIGGFGGGLPIGAGLPMGMPMGVPMGLGGGSGQVNLTNQSSTGGAQHVSNVNNNAQSIHQIPRFGMGGFGGGGFLSSLLGALI